MTDFLLTAGAIERLPSATPLSPWHPPDLMNRDFSATRPDEKYVGDITFRNDGQLRKLLGWYPEARESGTTVSKHRLGYSGNRLGRREVWFWAMQLITPRQAGSPFAAYYQRLRTRGVPGHAAVGHLAGKLISVLFFCLRSGRPYDPAQHVRALGLGDAK